MSDLTLTQAKRIAATMNAYKGKADFDSLAAYVSLQTGASRNDLAEVIKFIQEFVPEPTGKHDLKIQDEDNEAQTSLVDRIRDLTNQPINIAVELQYNYSVAKALLEQIISSNKKVTDGEEVRKTLREISRFSESMLKMQERVYNIQQMQQFQETVLNLLEDQAPLLREQLVQCLLETEL